MKSNKGKHEGLWLDWTVPLQQPRLGSSSAERSWTSWQIVIWTELAVRCGSRDGQQHPRLHQRAVQIQNCAPHSAWSSADGSYPLQYKKDVAKFKFSRGPPNWSVLGQAEEEGQTASEDLTASPWCLQGGDREIWARLRGLQQVNKRQWPRAGRWEVTTFYKAELSHLTWVEDRFSTEVVQASSWECFKMRQGKALSNLVLSRSWPSCEQKVRLYTFQGPFQPEWFCG